MMQAAAILYQLTGDRAYLIEAQHIAKECYNYFFTEFTPGSGGRFRVLKKGDVWFSAVMLRGYIQLYQQDRNKAYIDAFEKSMDYAWKHARDNKGLFGTDLSGKTNEDKKWLLTQAAIAEMYARLGTIR